MLLFVVDSTVHGARTDETAPVDVDNDNDNDGLASFKTRSEDSFGWADESDLSDVPEEIKYAFNFRCSICSNPHHCQ